MTLQNSLKRLIRARMTRTGESYSAARLAILAQNSKLSERAASLTVSMVQPDKRTGVMEHDLAHCLSSPTLECDVLVLPELIGGNSSVIEYEATIKAIAIKYGCYVVGGSHYRNGPGGQVNAGVVVDNTGDTVCSYEKLRPYGCENEAGVLGGDKVGQFTVKGHQVAVFICSDIWFSESVGLLSGSPDLLLIPSFSITQRGTPDKAKRLWRHMMIARAYEYSAYVGVCDWAHPCEFEGLPAAGVSGFADPRPDDEWFFEQHGIEVLQTYRLNMEKLDGFRKNRFSRGFLTRSG